MIESFLKNSKITVCFFGKKIEEIYSDKNAPDYEEKSFNVLNYENDSDLNNIIKKYDPHVFVTFDNWQNITFSVMDIMILEENGSIVPLLYPQKNWEGK